MELRDIEKKLYDEYIWRVYNCIVRKVHYLNIINDEDTLKFRIAEINAELSGIFNLYQDIRYSLGTLSLYDDLNKDNINKYQCSLDTAEYQYPCIGTINYFGEELPWYIDDYGMDTFIEISVDGKYYQISTAYDRDWWYEVDKLQGLDKYLKANTEEECNELIDYIKHKYNVEETSSNI